jgi:hypothetical protein
MDDRDLRYTVLTLAIESKKDQPIEDQLAAAEKLYKWIVHDLPVTETK